MTGKLTARELLTDPVTVILSGAAALGHLLGVAWIKAAVAVVWANVSTLFTALSVSGMTLAPRVDFLPEGPLTAAALVVGAVYVLKLVDKLIDAVQARV